MLCLAAVGCQSGDCEPSSSHPTCGDGLTGTRRWILRDSTGTLVTGQSTDSFGGIDGAVSKTAL
jgi:hypothetical protein